MYSRCSYVLTPGPDLLAVMPSLQYLLGHMRIARTLWIESEGSGRMLEVEEEQASALERTVP